MTKLIRLNKYLEVVRNSLNFSTGELQNFWKREEKKTLRKIASL